MQILQDEAHVFDNFEKKYKMEFGFCLKNSTFAVLKKIVEKKQNAYHTAISS